MWQMETLFIITNFFFWHHVFNSLLLQTCLNAALSGKGLHWPLTMVPPNVYIAMDSSRLGVYFMF